MRKRRTLKEKFDNSLMTLLGLVIGDIPILLILALKYMLGADGFWQNFVVWGLGLFLGAIQLVFWIVMVFFIHTVWSD